MFLKLFVSFQLLERISQFWVFYFIFISSYLSNIFLIIPHFLAFYLNKCCVRIYTQLTNDRLNLCDSSPANNLLAFKYVNNSIYRSPVPTITRFSKTLKQETVNAYKFKPYLDKNVMEKDCLECKITRRTAELVLTGYCVYNSQILPSFRSLRQTPASTRYTFLFTG